MGKIFISYRREDAAEAAGRLSDNLVEHFGRENIFMDVDGIALGRDFRTVIDETLGQCGVMLAVIGKGWLQETDAKGNRRLDQPGDFVRLEITTALRRDIPVIPVCVQGAGVPSPDDLPDELKDFAFRNAFELTHARWSSDFQLLSERLRPYMGEPATQPTSRPSPAPSHIPPPAHSAGVQQPQTLAPPVAVPAVQKKSSKKIVKWVLVGALVAMLLMAFSGGGEAALGGLFLFGLPAAFLAWDPAKWFVAKT